MAGEMNKYSPNNLTVPAWALSLKGTFRSSFLLNWSKNVNLSSSTLLGLDDATSLWSGITESMGPQLGEFLPKLLGAAIVLIVGYIIARVVRWIVTNVVNKTGLANKLSSFTGSQSGGDAGTGFGIGAFWIVMLFVALACLNALGLDGVSEPLADMLKQFFAFLPKIIGAVAIGAVAYLVATMAKFGVGKGLTMSNADERLKLKPGTLTNTLPMAAFCFILLFFLPNIFGALEMEELSEPVSNMVGDIIGFLPNLFGASIIMGVFFFIGKLVSTLLGNFLGGVGFDKVPQHLGLMSDTSSMSATPSQLAGKASMGAILLMGISQAVEKLELDVLTNVFREVWDFGTPVIIGVVILAIGLWLANLAKKAVSASGMQNSAMVSNIAFAGIMVLTGVIALKKMGLAGQIVDLGFGLTLGGIALAASLAFGLGGRDAAAKFLDKRVK